MSVPVSWTQFTQENLERARKQRELSVKLRGEMDALMKACATDMWNKSNCVSNAFAARVQQTKDANSKMLVALQKVCNPRCGDRGSNTKLQSDGLTYALAGVA